MNVKKIGRSKTIAITLVITCLLIGIIPASALIPWTDTANPGALHKFFLFWGGVYNGGNFQYYDQNNAWYPSVDPAFRLYFLYIYPTIPEQSDFEKLARQAMESWTNIDYSNSKNNIKFNEVTNYASSHLDMFVTADETPGILGWTVYWIDETGGYNKKNNQNKAVSYILDIDDHWIGAEVHLSQNKIGLPSNDENRIKSLFAHEIGHAFGLGHDPSPGALMNVAYNSSTKPLLTPGTLEKSSVYERYRQFMW